MLMWRSRLGLFTRSLVTRNRDLAWNGRRYGGSVEYHGTLGISTPVVLQILVGNLQINLKRLLQSFVGCTK